MQKTSEELNEAQRLAVEHKDGPAMVVAGAGTGKTRVIVERIVRLIESGVKPESIVALTFTEKAAQEMLDRTNGLRGSYATDLNIYTFNAFGQELLREFAVDIGLGTNLRLVGDIGKVVLLRDHIDELGLEYFAPVSSPDGQLDQLASYFSKLKQQLVKPDEYNSFVAKLPSNDEAEKLEKQKHQELAGAFTKYIEIARSKNVVDYDDQIYMVVELLESRPNILRQLQKRYQYLLVDEFQDTNPMQSKLLDLLAAEHKNLMVVGDDDQSIYGWRGATLSNILEFTKRYPKAKEVTLIQNYRSGQHILDNSYKLIQNNNPDRLEVINKLDKKLKGLEKGKKPTLKQFGNLDAELDWVASDIKQQIADGADPSQIAVLARRGRGGVSRVHAALEVRHVDHNVLGVTTDLYQQPLVISMIEALKATVDPRDNNAIYHTLSGPLFDCDARILGEVASITRKQFVSFEEALDEEKYPEIKEALNTVKSWQKIANQTSVGSLSYKMIEETGLKDKLINAAEDSEEDALNAQALFQWFSTLRSFEEISDSPSALSYLDSFETIKAEGETIDDTSLIDTNKPTVMTVHKAKGLEWEHVYIVDCTEYSFPLRKRGSSLMVPDELSKTSKADDHFHEERRLMYVASTRAKSKLTYTLSSTHTGVTKRKPSRFILEMFDDVREAENVATQRNLNIFEAVDKPEKKLSLPSSMRSGNNLILSASQANDYFRCPLDFKYRHILGVPPAPSPHAFVGTIFHGYMQQINEAKIKGGQIPSLESLTKQLEDEWPKEGYLTKNQRERALKTAQKSLATAYERVANEPIPVAVEQPFKVHVPNSRLILKGRIDVVMPTDNGVEIRDYKTSTSATTPEKAKRATSGSKQLDMYALAWRLQNDEMPALVSLDFVQTNQLGSIKKQPKTLDNLEVKLAEMADNILSNSFKPGYSHDFCRHPLLS